MNFDVVIIGGGIIGNCIAAHLAKENLKVLIIDSNNLGTSASLAAAGLFQVQLSELGNEELIEYCRDSFDYFPIFYEKINSENKNIDLGFRKSGSLYFAFEDKEIELKKNEYKKLKINPNVIPLNKEAILDLEPLASKNITGGFHYPEEGYINNPRFLKAIISSNQSNKTSYIEEKVIDISISKDKIDYVTLSNKEKVFAKDFILCNGAWANGLLKKILGISKDLIIGVKGEIIQLEIEGDIPIKKIIISHDGYVVPRPRTNLLEKNSIIIGGTKENIEELSSSTFKNTLPSTLKLITILGKLLPSLNTLPIMNSWAGVRPKTLDSLPIIDRPLDNMFISAGHYRNGILMGPLTGKIISDLIINRSTNYNIEKFRSDRFNTLTH